MIMGYKDHRVVYLHGVKFTTYVIAHGWRAGRRAGWADLPDGVMMPAAYLTATAGLDWFDAWNGKPRIATDAMIQAAARDIADSMIADARTSGKDPVVFVTGNRYMPPMRSFSQAEEIWDDPRNDDGEKFGWLCELIEMMLADANVALECPDYDNALYVVDLNRFEWREDEAGEELGDDWIPRTDARWVRVTSPDGCTWEGIVISDEHDGQTSVRVQVTRCDTPHHEVGDEADADTVNITDIDPEV
jgi:hypothetical protein